jgi:ABC-type Na+ efflux pump permease subunit
VRAAWLIACNDLRLFLRDKAHYFWLFGFPLMFAFFMGFAFRNNSAGKPVEVPVPVQNEDAGPFGQQITDELARSGFTTNATRAVEMVVLIPADFSSSLAAGKPSPLDLLINGAKSDEVTLVQMKLTRVLLKLNGTHLPKMGSEAALIVESITNKASDIPMVALKSGWGTRKPMPQGFRQSLPGILVMFVMMNLLIFGGTTMASERREGVLRRLLVQPLRRGELIAGKITGLILLGAVQIVLMLLVGKWFMKIDYAGNAPIVLFTLLLYSWVAASLGVLVGCVLREEKVVVVCVLASMAMAALGGCWWPLEIVPEHVRTIGHFFPSTWAMKALHQLISFGGGFKEVFLPLLVLAAFAGAANVLAVKLFKS